MATLSEALAGVARDGDRWRSATPEGWTQGRTLYGGMTAAMAAHVAAAFAPGLPPLRALQFAFVGPAAGDLVFQPRLLRQGRAATILGVECFGDGKLAAQGLFTYGAARESAVRHADSWRDPPPPEACESFRDESHPTIGFFRNFEMRLAAGTRPFSGPEAAADFTVWVRHRDDGGVDPLIALIALADALPPAAMARFPTFAPISTMTWGVDFALGQPPRGWFLSRARAEASADGYSQQAMDLYARDGARVAAGRQTVAIFI